jgi:hypothetical protein
VNWTRELKTSHECPECVGTDRAHPIAEYKYTLPDGSPIKLQPGDVYYSTHAVDTRACDWDNCDGRHIVCMCPDPKYPESGHPWNVSRRASNCTLPDDREHRCWVISGGIEDGTIHVNKAGRTCTAGAGSIQTYNWHGFLHRGDLHATCTPGCR